MSWMSNTSMSMSRSIAGGRLLVAPYRLNTGTPVFVSRPSRDRGAGLGGAAEAMLGREDRGELHAGCSAAEQVGQVPAADPAGLIGDQADALAGQRRKGSGGEGCRSSHHAGSRVAVA